MAPRDAALVGHERHACPHVSNIVLLTHMCDRGTCAGSSAHPPVTQSPLFPGPLPLGTENPSALGQREDLQALGLVALELVFAALAEGSTATGPALQRLLMDVFASDTRAFR